MESSVKPTESPAMQNQAETAPLTQDTDALREKIVDVLRSIYDPEIPVNIYEIGLIYSVDIDPANAVNIRMTLTSPACPAAGTLPGEVEDVRGGASVRAARRRLPATRLGGGRLTPGQPRLTCARVAPEAAA